MRAIFSAYRRDGLDVRLSGRLGESEAANTSLRYCGCFDVDRFVQWSLICFAILEQESFVRQVVDPVLYPDSSAFDGCDSACTFAIADAEKDDAESRSGNDAADRQNEGERRLSRLVLNEISLTGSYLQFRTASKSDVKIDITTYRKIGVRIILDEILRS